MTARAPRLDPSGRPLKNVGREAVLAIAIVLSWIVTVAFVLWLTRPDAGVAVGPTPFLAGIALVAWGGAEYTGLRHGMVWPSSACGIVGPLSVGFAICFATPELREAPFAVKMSVISLSSAVLMMIFLFRFRLPGLVSPVITFTLVALFLTLYGTDAARLRQMEGFSPRGIIAMLMDNPLWAALFTVLGGAALVFARRLDLKGDDFGLAAARPLHLVGGGVSALVAGRAAALAPEPLDVILLAALWIAAWVYVLRINRIAVLFAAHFAMAKPAILAVGGLFGVSTLSIWEWSALFWAILVVDLVAWFWLHRLSRRLDWTLGPGGRKPPLDRPGIWWRYWPYASDKPKTAEKA